MTNVAPDQRAKELIGLLTPDRLRIIHDHARTSYPKECCGMILASGIVRVCENAQDKLHKLDPASFSRTSANAYCFDVADQLFLARSLEGDDPVRIVYHSHPDAAPDFSETDRRGAMIGDEALYPGLAILVIQCGACVIGPARLYFMDNKVWRGFDVSPQTL